MPDSLKTLLILTCVVIVLLVLWAITIGFTYWDGFSRRRLPGGQAAAWVALVALVPGVGFAAYLFARLLDRSMPLRPAEGVAPGQATLLKRSEEADAGTIAAVAMAQAVPAVMVPTQETRAVMAQAEVPARTLQLYRLTVIAGPHIGPEYRLEVLPVKIGRGREVSIPLDDDPGVSRLHAEIYEQAGKLWIRDLKSLHGTQVNGVTVQEKSLEPGDEIQVGESILMVGVQEEHP